jgi:NAD(P)-dependent dehydrogenase (short-subunit alcohol dehydrogenase family)
MKLKDRVALITGAGSGIGRAAALLFAQEGAWVGALDYHEKEVNATVEAIARQNGRALPLVADVSKADQMQQAVQQLVERWGRIEVVFANAGINGVWAPIDEIEPEEWDQTMNVNLRGVFLTFKYTVPYLRRQGGAVVVTSSVQGTRTFIIPGSTAYACTKAAVVTLAKKLALELAQDNIRVNAVCPGATVTNIGASTVRRNTEKITLPFELPRGKGLLPQGGRATPEQVAKLVLFLVSDEADMITGTEVWIDGGISLV